MTGKRKKKNKSKSKNQKVEEIVTEEVLAQDVAADIADDQVVEAATAETGDAVLESVTGSLEMAGQAMEFFEGEEPADELEASEPEVSHDVMEDDDQQELLADPNAQDHFVDQEQLISVLESMLFASDRPVGLGTFKTVFKGTSIRSKDIKKGLEDLAGSYAQASRGVTLEEIGNGWQLRTKVDNMPFLTKLGKAKPFKLSGPALEVLSILAYKQPLVKSEVDHIRGVESGHLVRALMDRGLVSFQGKSDLPGKPMQYGTTRKFLEIFGLRNLKELPSLEEIDQLIPEGIGYEDDEEKLSDVTDSMSEEVSARYSEGEDELEKITEKLGDIDTSSEFFEQEKVRQKEKRELEKARDIQEAIDLGEDVEPKDVRWLERRNQKIAEEELAASDGSQPSDDSADTDDLETQADDEPLSEALDALTEESVSMKLAPATESMATEVEAEPEIAIEGDVLPEVDPFEDMDL